MNAQYTLARSYGNTGGSNEAQTSANNARELDDFDYDIGYNNFDVRHTFNLSALYTIPYAGRGRALLGGWNVGGHPQRRSGLPIDVKVVRPDVVYVDGAGSVFANPAADRTAVINTPGGGASRNVRRPDLVPGVDPFVKDGGLVFLNPAAFAIPEPGTFGNLQRGSLHGPSFKQVDLVDRQAGRNRRHVEYRAAGRDLQPVQHRQLRQPGRHAASGTARQQPDRGQQGSARAAVHRRRRRHVRQDDEHGGPDRRSRHEPAGPVRAASELLVTGAGPPAHRRARPAGAAAT